MNVSPGDIVGPLSVLGLYPRKPGIPGPAGKSAYQVWLDNGNVGTIDDFLNSLEGKSAYDIWIALGNVGDESDFIEFLKGEDGSPGLPGKSAYQTWLDEGNVGSEEDFLNSLKGPIGPVGGAFVQDNFTATSTMLTEKQVLLSAVPADPFRVALLIYKGIEQEPGVDFIVMDQTLSWAGLALELLLEVGNKFVVRYLPTT